MTRWRVAFLVACAVHLVVLYAPFAPAPEPRIPWSDKAVHLLVFAAVVYTGARIRLPLRWLAGVLLAEAVLSEVVQHTLLPQRSGDVLDTLADAAGVAIGAWAAGVFSARTT